MSGIALFVTTCDDYLVGRSSNPVSCPEEMIEVPGGTFQMGESPSDTEAANGSIRHTVTLSAYCIDKTEVTVRDYTACVQAKGCPISPPIRNVLPGRTVIDRNEASTASEFWSRYCNRDDRPDHPINCVDWFQATAYCTWAGRHLPTEAEWEYAARGNDNRLYPWGNMPPNTGLMNGCDGDCVKMGEREIGSNFKEIYGEIPGNDGWERTAPVGSFPAGASPFGVLDMAGNVMEWTADWFGAYSSGPVTNPRGPASGTRRVTRGGGWLSSAEEEMRSTLRTPDDPTQRRVRLGFRCARDPRSSTVP